MEKSEKFRWTNKSVLRLADGDNPITVIEKRARELVLLARDAGWSGPPYNPIAIADMLKIPVEASADVADARTMSTSNGLVIQFNPTQARERVRFSIAHEIAHALFPDVAAKVRHRSYANVGDEWQLEMLCNIAAAEFVMPLGSLSVRDQIPPLEDLMIERRRFDVSAEAFLIRTAKTTNQPVLMYCASPMSADAALREYRVDYTVLSKSAPRLTLAHTAIPSTSVIHACTAIGYTDRCRESWPLYDELDVECVGIPGFPGSPYPRVAGLIRFGSSAGADQALRFVHGDVLEPRGAEPKIICQVVNDTALRWGGGVARSTARKFPAVHRAFTAWIASVSRSKRLGKVHFAQAEQSLFIASLVAQAGYGESSLPRIRYAALEQCLARVVEFATEQAATVHMPRIGTGLAGGAWDTVEEIISATLVNGGIGVTVYDLPPKKISTGAELL